MSLQRQHFPLSYLMTLSLCPCRGLNTLPPAQRPGPHSPNQAAVKECIFDHVSFFFTRMNVSITVAKTMQPAKPVLQTRDTAACVLLDLKEITVRMVSFWGNTELRL